MALRYSRESLVEKVTLSTDLREVGWEPSGSLGEEYSGQEESRQGPEAAVPLCSRSSKKAGEAEVE